MGDNASFRYGRNTSASGLEFAPVRKQSRFSQYTTQFQQPVTQQASSQQVPVASPVQVSALSEQQVQAQVAPQQHSSQLDQSYQSYATAPQQPLAFGQQNIDQTDQDVDSALSDLFTEQPETVRKRDFPASNIIRPSLDDSKEKRSKVRSFFAISSVALGFAIIGVSLWFLMGNRPAVSPSLRAKAGFPVYDVAMNGRFKVDRKTVELGQNNNIVFALNQTDKDARFVISQQAIPDVIKGEEQFNQFLDETESFAVMDTKIGKAYFTKPANIGSDISVVVKTDTTLMFIRGPGTTSEEDWSSLLATLQK